MPPETSGATLAEMTEREQFAEAIASARERVSRDRREIESRDMKVWMARRWRCLFLDGAEKDKRAVSAASRALSHRFTDVAIRLPDSRPARQRVAERFLVDGARDDWRLEMPPLQAPRLEDTTVVYVSGLFTELAPKMPFTPGFPELVNELGCEVIRAKTHTIQDVDKSAADLKRTLETGAGADAFGEPIEDPTPPRRDIVMLGYSKGAPEILSLLADHPELEERIKAVVFWGGAVGGSYIADDLYQYLKGLDGESFRNSMSKVVRFFMPGSSKGADRDIASLSRVDVLGAMRSLTTRVRRDFLDSHVPLFQDMGIPFLNVIGSVNLADVPPHQMPIARGVRSRDPLNDAMVTQEQARLPIAMSTDVGVVRAYHLDLGCPPFPASARFFSAQQNHPFPTQAALLATVGLLAELGIVA